MPNNAALQLRPHDKLKKLFSDVDDAERRRLLAPVTRKESTKLSSSAKQQALASEISLCFEMAKQSDDPAVIVQQFRQAERCRQQIGISWSRWAQGGVRCPPFVTPVEDRTAHDAWWTFIRARTGELADRADDASERVGVALRAVFDMPAHTVAGALAKARLLQLAKDIEDGWDQDHGLICHEPEPNVWFNSVIADLERLAGAA